VANEFIKAERIVSVGLALLERELTIPALMWRDAAGDFAGAKDDTISIRLPAYANARTRDLRSGSTRTRDELHERKVDVTLDTDVYKDVIITDEQLTLDIENFGTQVLNPVLGSIARKLEDIAVDLMQGATYENSAELDPDDPYLGLVDARRYLNDARVPNGGRVAVVGTEIEAQMLKSDRLTKFDNAGASGASAVAEASIGRMAGFTVVTSPALDPDEGYAFHKSAYVLSSRAPVVPSGAPYGASASSGGFAIRVVRVLDSEAIVDILATDSWVGTNVVTDQGTVTNGIFTPAEDPTESGSDAVFVRAVELTLGS
jgi:N4-gp56 family major capsid protein